MYGDFGIQRLGGGATIVVLCVLLYSIGIIMMIMIMIVTGLMYILS